MIPAILILGILGTMIYIAYRYCSDWLLNRKRTLQFANEYEKALLGDDKNRALLAGRAYYSALRRGRLTEQDEQTIQNNLLFMKSTHDEVIPRPFNIDQD